jgi:hypothetical protein
MLTIAQLAVGMALGLYVGLLLRWVAFRNDPAGQLRSELEAMKTELEEASERQKKDFHRRRVAHNCLIFRRNQRKTAGRKRQSWASPLLPTHFFFPLSAGRRSFRSASSENGF